MIKYRNRIDNYIKNSIYKNAKKMTSRIKKLIFRLFFSNNFKHGITRKRQPLGTGKSHSGEIFQCISMCFNNTFRIIFFFNSYVKNPNYVCIPVIHQKRHTVVRFLFEQYTMI